MYNALFLYLDGRLSYILPLPSIRSAVVPCLCTAGPDVEGWVTRWASGRGKNHLIVRIESSPFRTKFQHGFELRAISCCFSELDRTHFESLRTFSRPASSWTSSRLCQSGSWLCWDDIGEHKPRYIIDIYIYIFYSYSNWRIIFFYEPFGIQCS